jgi:inositol oxygenase
MSNTVFRNFEAVEGTHVERTYQEMYSGQTIDHVQQMHAQYLAAPKFAELGVWDALELLSQVVDESDPDTELPQITHALQTAQSLEMLTKDNPAFAGKDWLPLVGLIHDLGKIMLLKEFGSLPQWSVVGDIFPINIPLHPAAVYQHKGFHVANAAINGSVEPPAKGCGFDALKFSWSHDVYLAEVLERSGSTLPPEALYMIRYHSFYPWHTPPQSWNVETQGRPYQEYASEKDWQMLPYLHLLQKSDLYSKTPVLPERKTYEALVATYIPHKLRF